MKKMTINALIIFAYIIFASQMLLIFGKVTVLKGSEYRESNYSGGKMKLICLTEDDGSALVWNYNLHYNFYSEINNNYKSQDLNKFSNQEIDCKMNENKGCLESWTKTNWSLTNSLKTSMGPVFDRRWEEFKQHEHFQNTFKHVYFELPTAVKLSFSVRTFRSANILICNAKRYLHDDCYWITIGSRNDTLSCIRKCPMGVPILGTYRSMDCEFVVRPFLYAPLSVNEWQSFTITWNSVKQKVVVYDTEKSIMTYEDMEKRKFPNSYMFIGSSSNMLFRFHIYDFLHTTVEGAALTSPPFQLNNKIICIQLLVGLCVDCDAHIMLRDYTRHEQLISVIVTGSSRAAEHKLPMWQSIKITKKFLETEYNSYNRSMTIQLIPKLNNKNTSNPLWAIANIRECPDANTLRKNDLFTASDYKAKYHYSWKSDLCQKLFYDERAVVNPLSSVKSNINLDDANCPEGKIGPQCLISCEHDLNSNSNCQGTRICHENGCTCPPGFSGDTCSKPCELNRYGHGCKKTCGSCLYGNHCNIITGVCNSGCDNTKEIYLPSLCQKSVVKPEAPSVISNETTIWANFSMTWENEYEEIPVLYTFIIKGQMTQLTWKKLYRNMTNLTTYFKNLDPGTTYHIGFALDFNGVKAYSDWETIETKCNPAENFNVTPEENSLIIDGRITSEYPCPINWYHLIIHNINTGENITKISMSFPYKLEDLPSYTSFNVTILHTNKKLFSQEIRTLEGVPSQVLDLEGKLSANIEITLVWKPPHYSNGEIVRYEVILKVKEYYGCTNLQLSTPNNHIIKKSITETTIVIPGLHSFASYSAQIIAHNSRLSSSPAEIIFNTGESEIPSEIFSKVRVEDWKLLWNPPEDCTMITGSLNARIKIRGISDNVKYFNVIKQTGYYSYDLSQLNPKLNGVERYEATIYVIRDYKAKENTSAYQKYEFETLPTAPPKVTYLEVVEIDSRQIPAMIHLRWQSPVPPLNGKLRNYDIQLCNASDKHCLAIEVQLNETCDLWDGYICKVIKEPRSSRSSIEVLAYNINVSEPSLPALVTDDKLHRATPDAPGNYTYTINHNSVIDLKWLHPWRTGGHLKSFRIGINETFSNLKSRISQSSINEIFEYPVTQYMRDYTERLYLLPSTQYIIYIEAVTVANISSDSKFVEIHTPSTAAFDGDLDVMVNKSDSTVLLNIPSVLNDTQGSTMHIIVKGPNLCEQYSDVPETLRVQAGVKMDEIAWQAAEVLTSELAGGRFKIGDNKIYGNAKNCPLKPEEFYEIVIIATERNSSTEPIMLTKSIRIGKFPSYHYEVWIISIILFFILASAASYLYRRNRRKLTE